MENLAVAEAIAAQLHLAVPPIALAFGKELAADVATLGREVPSACALWRVAEHKVFYAPAATHYNCPIGAMVMGFGLPDPIKARLMDLMSTMVGNHYIGASELEKIPVMSQQPAGITYGPLSVFPIQPDLVLLWVTPRQAMLLNEASGTAQWTAATLGLATFGRPACSALPQA